MSAEKSRSGSDNKFPEWYCPYKIPLEFSNAIPPLVYLAGLYVDKNPVHRAIMEMVKMKQPNKDFQPAYVDVPLDHKFHTKKQNKHEHIENYVPRGIIKTNWLKKHMQLVPSVIVAFFDMNWTDPYWNEKKNECAKRVRELKTELSPHGTQILVVLIKTADAGEDNFSTDRASALCAAADIPPKALYILSHTHSERIQACVQRLELGMKEASKVYYLGRIRRVKNWKDRTMDLSLLARYNFKTAFFQEIRRDYVSSLSHYHASEEMIRTIKPNDSNIQQIRCVASWLNYRICRLNLLKSDYKEAQNHFEKFMWTFKKMDGNPQIAFEHLAWVQQQYYYFGELLRHFYRPGMTTLDPVTYFLAAVDHSEKRFKKSKETAESEGTIAFPNEMKEYLNVKDRDCEYVGQRPWRPDAFNPDATFIPEDINAIQALKHFEQRYDHSDDRIATLGIASDFCRDQQRLRTRSQLMMMMGIEFFAQSEFHRCVMLMTHVLREFGRDKGTMLLYLVAECGFRAACSDGDVAAYISFLVFLLKRDLSIFVSDDRRKELWSKFLAIQNKKLPAPEEGCSLIEDKWNSALSSPYTSYVGVHRDGIVDAVFHFASDTVRAVAVSEVQVELTNKVDFPIKIKKCGVGISINDYNCDSVMELTLEPGQTHELSLFFTPLSKDVGKIIQIHLGYIDIGEKDASVILHYSALLGISPYLWNDGKKEKAKQIIAKIEPNMPSLRPKITREDPMLVNEWHKVLVSWTNTDTAAYSKLNLTFMVVATDPADIIITSDPFKEVKFGTLTHTVEAEELGPNSSIETTLFIKCTNPQRTELQLMTKAKYNDNLRQPITNELIEHIEVIKPFELAQKARNLQTDEICNIISSEEFLVQFQIKNNSKCALYIKQLKVRNMLPASDDDSLSTELQDVTMLEGETVQTVGSFILKSSAEERMGTLEITWRRDGEDVPTSTSVIPIRPVNFSPTASIYVEGVFSNKAKGDLKRPMQIKYVIHNRSDKTHDLWISLDSTECFMNAGPKKVNLKITATESVDMHYVLFPLKTGLLKTPKLMIDVVGANGDLQGAGDNVSVIHKNVVKTIFVSRATED